MASHILFRTAASALAAVYCLAAAGADGDTTPAANAVVIEVNGVSLTMADVEQRRPSALFQARTSYYEAQRKTIEEVADEVLLEQQARKEGLTVAQLLEKHVNSVLPKDPSDEALHVYYEGVETTEPYEKVRDQIIDSLRQRRTAKAKTAYLQSLRSQAHVIIRLAPQRAPISMKGVPVRGAEAARITLLEFADYECPYCQQIRPVLERIEAEYKGTLAFAYKDYPLAMHPNAQKAAEAAHCAGAQSKFWEYHDMLGGGKSLDPSALKGYARELKLDAAAFDKCLDGGEKSELVKTQLSEAQALGLQGTPTLFVNGRYISGALTYERVRSVITEELSSMDIKVPARAANGPAHQ